MISKEEQEQFWLQKIHCGPDGERLEFRKISEYYLRNINRSTTFRLYDRSAIKKELRRRNPVRRTIRQLKKAEQSENRKKRTLAKAARKALQKYLNL
jgi:hypothetical protein